jgi:hypothetical protein
MAPVIRWLVDVIAFLLPALVTLAGLRLDRSTFRNRSLIPIVAWGSVFPAVAVPVGLIGTTRISRASWIELALAVVGLLLVECHWLIMAVVHGSHRPRQETSLLASQPGLFCVLGTPVVIDSGFQRQSRNRQGDPAPASVPPLASY